MRLGLRTLWSFRATIHEERRRLLQLLLPFVSSMKGVALSIYLYIYPLLVSLR
jgi:hypothetical protein